MELPCAILIDLDDTLLDDSSKAEPCWADACAALASRLDGLDTDAIRAEIRNHASWYWSDAKRHRTGRLDLRATTRQIVERAFETLAAPDQAVAHDLADAYRDLRDERAELFPGAVEALERLREQGVRLGMMTNGAAAAQRAKIERFQLARHFDHIVIEGEFGAGKPDRSVYETLLTALGTEPADTWATGDNLELDVLAPMKLGLHGIWIDAGNKGCDGREDKPHRIVAAFTEILPA